MVGDDKGIGFEIFGLIDVNFKSGINIFDILLGIPKI